ILGTKVLSTVNIIVALTIYTVSLLIRNVIDGLRSMPPDVRQSAIAVGYGSLHRVIAVDLPIAVPVIFAGLRVVTVANISMVSVGAVIGIGGLGELFTLGFQKDFLTPVVLGVSTLIALPIGLRIGHTRHGAFLAINLGNAARALPSLGLLMIAVLLTNEIGFLPVLIALVALGIPPILASTYAGLAGVDPAT